MKSKYSGTGRKINNSVNESGEKKEDLTLPPISPRNSKKKYKNTTPRYLREYRKRKEQEK